MDRRISKTKNALKSALAKLMETKSYNEISVTDLCEKADVNRGTFYLHYKTINDFVKEIEDALIARIGKIILKHYPVANDEYKELCVDITNVIIEDKEFLSKLVGKNGDQTFVRNVSRYTRELTLKLNKFSIDEDDEKYYNFYITFLVDGGIGVLLSWLINGCKDDIMEIINQFVKLLLRVVTPTNNK